MHHQPFDTKLETRNELKPCSNPCPFFLSPLTKPIFLFFFLRQRRRRRRREVVVVLCLHLCFGLLFFFFLLLPPLPALPRRAHAAALPVPRRRRRRPPSGMTTFGPDAQHTPADPSRHSSPPRRTSCCALWATTRRAACLTVRGPTLPWRAAPSPLASCAHTARPAQRCSSTTSGACRRRSARRLLALPSGLCA